MPRGTRQLATGCKRTYCQVLATLNVQSLVTNCHGKKKTAAECERDRRGPRAFNASWTLGPYGTNKGGLSSSRSAARAAVKTGKAALFLLGLKRKEPPWREMGARREAFFLARLAGKEERCGGRGWFLCSYPGGSRRPPQELHALGFCRVQPARLRLARIGGEAARLRRRPSSAARALL
jgi:hypothetical protein